MLRASGWRDRGFSPQKIPKREGANGENVLADGGSSLGFYDLDMRFGVWKQGLWFRVQGLEFGVYLFEDPIQPVG